MNSISISCYEIFKTGIYFTWSWLLFGLDICSTEINCFFKLRLLKKLSTKCKLSVCVLIGSNSHFMTFLISWNKDQIFDFSERGFTHHTCRAYLNRTLLEEVCLIPHISSCTKNKNKNINKNLKICLCLVMQK